MPNRNHRSRNNGGLSKRDRGRGARAGRPPVTTPREVSVERVDDYTTIVRTPEALPDEGLESLVLHVRDLCRIIAGPGKPIEAAGVWLTPDEAILMEQPSLGPELDGIEGKDERRWQHP